jgi:hypothetical protein
VAGFPGVSAYGGRFRTWGRTGALSPRTGSAVLARRSAHHPPEGQEPARPALHAANGNAGAQDRDHQREERPYWRRSLRTSWAAVGAALASTWFVWGASSAAVQKANTAKDALAATDRP